MRTRLHPIAVNAQAQATAELLNGGFFDLMTGEQPVSTDEEVPDQWRLSRSTFGNVAFAAPRNGLLVANPISKAIAVRTGKPTWCRCLTKDLIPVMDGSVGATDANAITKVATIVEGQIVNISEFRHVIRSQEED